ncbi:alpha/beta hydrolase [Rummeliibacillus sp. NPDC094406]|uniref:alpha/beta hydrolase n=1 Tax=Rummeliibacillus sp. NPDC094406 TaxID=3364511 RepID=UPI00380F8BE9
MNSPFTFIHSAPKNMEHGKLYPAVFLMHGMGSNEQDLPGLLDEIKDQCHIFSLQGPIIQPPGYAFFTIEEFGKPHRNVFDQVIIHIMNFIEEAITEYPIDAEKIFLMGFSQGAILSKSLAVAMGKEKLAGIVALSGYTPDFVKNQYQKHSVQDMPVFISHGTMDMALPYQWGEASRDFFTEQGSNVTFKSFEDGHGVTPEVQESLIAFLKENM